MLPIHGDTCSSPPPKTLGGTCIIIYHAVIVYFRVFLTCLILTLTSVLISPVKLGDPPSFILHPKRKVSLPGDTVTFIVEAEGMGPLQYNWLCDNQMMDEAEGPVLTLTGVKEADSGNYQCQVENPVGKAVSEPVELQVGEYYH